MAVRSELVEHAMEKITELSTRFDVHVKAQESINKEHTSDIIELRINSVRQDGKLDALKEDTHRILKTLEANKHTFLSWFTALTPWIFLIGVVVLFYIQNSSKVTP